MPLAIGKRPLLARTQLDGVLAVVVHEHVDAVGAQRHLEEGADEAVTGLNQREGGLGHVVETTQTLVLEVLDLGQEPVVGGAVEDEGLVRQNLCCVSLCAQVDEANLQVVHAQTKECILKLAECTKRPGLSTALRVQPEGRSS